MTPPQFTIQDGYLKELPHFKKELCIKGISSNLCESMYPGKCSCHKFEQHIASLRTYPILPDSTWDKKEGLIEGADFYIQYIGHADGDRVQYATPQPTQPAKGQEVDQLELWEKVIDHMDEYIERANNEYHVVSHKAIERLLTKYTLTPKPQ